MSRALIQRIVIAIFLVVAVTFSDAWADATSTTPAKILRVMEELSIDEVGNISGESDLVLPEDFYVRFKALMSPREIVMENGKRVERLRAPSVANVLRYLGTTSTAYETPEMSGDFDDEAATIHAKYRILGRSNFRHGRWAVALGVGLTDSQVSVHKFEARKDSCVIELRTRQQAAQLISRLKVTLPAGSSNIEFSNRTLELMYSAPAPAMPANATAARPEMRFDAKPKIMSALYKQYGNPKWTEMFAGRTVFQNNSPETVSDYRVRFRIEGYASWGPWEKCEKVFPGQTVVTPFYPVIDSRIADLKGSTPALAEIEYEYVRPSGEKVTETDSSRIKLLGMNEAIWSNLEFTENSSWFDIFRSAPMVVSSFTSATDPVMQDVVGMISKATAGKGATINDANALKFMGTLYNLLATNIAYETTPAAVEDGLLHQHLKYGRDVLRTHSGTCINLSILYASVCEAAGLHAYVVLIPHHAFAAVKLPQSSLPVFVETTGCGGGTKDTSFTFVQAREYAFRNYQRCFADGQIVEIDLAACRQQGVASPELPNAGSNPLKDWGIQAPEEPKDVEMPLMLVNLKQALDSINIRYSPVPDRTAVIMQFTDQQAGQWTITARSFEDTQRLLFISQAPNAVPENRRSEVEAKLMRINATIAHGTFDLHEDGTIGYRTSDNIRGTFVNPQAVQSELQLHIEMMKQHLPEFRQFTQAVAVRQAPAVPVSTGPGAGNPAAKGTRQVGDQDAGQYPIVGIWKTVSTDENGNQFTQVMALLVDGSYGSVIQGANGQKTELLGTWSLKNGHLTTSRSDGVVRQGHIRWDGKNRFIYSSSGGTIVYERVG